MDGLPQKSHFPWPSSCICAIAYFIFVPWHVLNLVLYLVPLHASLRSDTRSPRIHYQIIDSVICLIFHDLVFVFSPLHRLYFCHYTWIDSHYQLMGFVISLIFLDPTISKPIVIPVQYFFFAVLSKPHKKRLLCAAHCVEGGPPPICNDTKQTIDELPWTNIDIRQYASNMIILFDNNMAPNTFPFQNHFSQNFGKLDLWTLL